MGSIFKGIQPVLKAIVSAREKLFIGQQGATILKKILYGGPFYARTQRMKAKMPAVLNWKYDKFGPSEMPWLGDLEFEGDFIPFKFKSLNIKSDQTMYFRATLTGITDSISPEWSEEKYIGRPDKVRVYQGADRSISFNFKVFPKTLRDLQIQWEKLEYLVSLCYPASNDANQMVGPMMELTIGDMYVDVPGYLSSLSIEIDDSSPWETKSHIGRFPHIVTANCEFQYIGNEKLELGGKHYSNIIKAKRLAPPRPEVGFDIEDPIDVNDEIFTGG